MDEPIKGVYDIILGRYLSTEQWLNINVSEHIIEADYGPLKGSLTPMVDFGTYEFKV